EYGVVFGIATDAVSLLIQEFDTNRAIAGIRVDVDLGAAFEIERLERELPDVLQRLPQGDLRALGHRTDAGEAIERDRGHADPAPLPGFRLHAIERRDVGGAIIEADLVPMHDGGRVGQQRATVEQARFATRQKKLLAEGPLPGEPVAA